LQHLIPDVSLASVVAAILLFSPAGFLLGMVSPYAAKLKLQDAKKLGTTIGNLYALSTAGSIIGTFAAGFFLIPRFGTNTLLILLALTLVVLSVFLSLQVAKTLKVSAVALLLISLSIYTYSVQDFATKKFLDLDTAYNRIWLFETTKGDDKQPIRVMGINAEFHSAMYLDSDELVSEYTKFYHLARHFSPTFAHTLMIGGAGYSFPKSYLLLYPHATIDVVEIDPMVTELAKKYFKLPTSERMKIFHQDARVFLNHTSTKYDVIFGDAFGSRYAIPYHLTTLETVKKKYDLLNENGVVIVNTISALEGDKGKFLRAEYATYAAVFPQVYLFTASDNVSATDFQNVMLVALKSKNKVSFESEDPELQRMLHKIWTNKITADVPILTDDFAPVDQYINFAQ
jgi:spermidine synthase